MSKGKGKAKPTIGDGASDFMAQWKASKSRETSEMAAPASDVAETKGTIPEEQMLRNWKRGGAEVRVTRGSSVGYVKRCKKPNIPPPVARSAAPTAQPSTVNPTPSRITKPDPVPTKSVRERLLDASANVRELRIAVAMSRPRSIINLDPIAEAMDGKLAILGLDFGTAFTKAVVRWSGRHHAVDWSNAVEGDDHHLLASAFSERVDGCCVLGVHHQPGWTVHEGIKIQLLSAEDVTENVHLVDAVVFIALVFRYVNSWLTTTRPDAAQGIRWRLHVGLPTRSWDDDVTAETFKIVAQAGRVLACMSGPVTRVAAQVALQKTSQVDRPAVDVFPEFACQLYSYLRSSERREDLHALVDVGAGTLDVAYFNVFSRDGEELLPIFASKVERLGAHFLIAALAGAGGPTTWRDDDSSLSDEQASNRVGCPSLDVGKRRSLYLSSVADVFHAATCEAQQMYPTSPAFRRNDRVRLFLCGGGSRIPSIRERFGRIAREAPHIMGIRFDVSELVKPRDIVGQLESGFDRLSVAYGLSQNAANIGLVMRSAALEPLVPRERRSDVHRDDDR